MRRPLAALTAIICILASCGGDGASSEPPDSTAPPLTASPVTAPVSAASSTTAGDSPSPAPAERIVSLSPSLTEMLYAIGAGDQVVAVDKYSNYPAGTPTTDLSGFSPNVEAIAAYEPDLVVLANDRDGVVAALGTVGIPTLLLERATGVDATYAQLQALAAATGHDHEAAAVVAQMKDDIAALAARVPDRKAPLRYYYELGDDGHSATSDTFIGQVLATAGLASIADGVDDAAGGFPQLSSEHVLEEDPDVIFLAHTDGVNPTPDELAARAGWSELTAVHDGMVVELDPDVASRWGPRIVELLAVAVDSTVSTG